MTTEQKKEKKTREKKDIKDDNLEIKVDDVKYNEWLNGIYDISKISDNEVKEYYELFQYSGFNREIVLKQLYTKFSNNTKLVIQAIIVCALRGPKAASVIKLTNGSTLLELGIPASGGKGTKKLTCSRITSATADLAAYFMKKMGAPKRISSDLPGWLQFPAAGSMIK